MTREAELETCPDCKVVLPRCGGSRHAYLGASASCWEAYGRLLAREYEDPAYMAVHRETVDAYCSQHPGLRGRKTIQSVSVHLAGLCLTLERGVSGHHTTRVIAQLVEKHEHEFRWLPPPENLGDIRVLDVLKATDAGEHARAVRGWAEAVWSAWSRHHPRIRALVDGALAGRGGDAGRSR